MIVLFCLVAGEIPYIKVKVANETYYALDPNINRTKLAEQGVSRDFELFFQQVFFADS